MPSQDQLLADSDQANVMNDDALRNYEYQYGIMLNVERLDERAKFAQDIVNAVALFVKLHNAKPSALSSTVFTKNTMT